jgi:hypothetical protein
VARVPRLALLALLLILAGCGTDAAAPPKPDAAADAAAIRARVATYIGHMLAGDGERACAQFTPAYRRDADARAKQAGLGSCADVIGLYGEALKGSLPPNFAELATDPKRIIVVRVDDRARAAMTSPAGGPSLKQTTLRRVGSQWLIDSLGVTRPRER